MFKIIPGFVLGSKELRQHRRVKRSFRAREVALWLTHKWSGRRGARTETYVLTATLEAGGGRLLNGGVVFGVLLDSGPLGCISLCGG